MKLEEVTYEDDVLIVYDTKKNKLIKPILHNSKYVLQKNEVVLDSLIADLIIVFNKFYGIETMYCCGGHEGSNDNGQIAYIMFKESDYVIPFITKVMKIVQKFYNKKIKKSMKCNAVEFCIGVDTIPNRSQFTYVLNFNADGINTSRRIRYDLFKYIENNLKENI